MVDQNPYVTADNGHGDLAQLAGGVAVITGSASGTGYAIAEHAIRLGMYPVIADIETEAIERAIKDLGRATNEAAVEAFGFTTDVSSEENIQALAEAIEERFPGKPISLLCCNAGVGAGGGVLTATDIDWDFVMGVNLKGVAHCVRTFVPKMLDQDAPGSVVATSSQDGLCAAQGVYGVSKHACVALMEALHNELQGRLTTHVLCPNVVATNITSSERNRPDRFGGSEESRSHSAKGGIIQDRFQELGMPPSQCADYVFNAMQDGTFYVLAEADDDPGYIHREAETRMSSILNGERPFRPRSEFIARVFNPNAGK